MGKYYIAVTIGPVVDTLSMAESPAALWCASSLFSDLSHRICRLMCRQWPEGTLLMPVSEQEAPYQDGIGRYPDRIFFSVESPDPKELKLHMERITTAAKDALSRDLTETVPPLRRQPRQADAMGFLSRYLQTNYVIAPEAVANREGKNCILNLSQYLDSLELSQELPAEYTQHPLYTLFNSRKSGESSRNAYVRGCYLVPSDPCQMQLFTRCQGKWVVRDIESIADPNPEQTRGKARNYFAVVQSDGDRIGNLLQACREEEDIRAFSQACMTYNSAAIRAVGEYGGMTIYAGGDDLLLLAPLEGVNGENLIGLCRGISREFDKAFQPVLDSMAAAGRPVAQRPTLSFGISVQHIRSPLYEALEQARAMLFGYAKRTLEEKNTIAIRVSKHSGQSVQLLLPNADGSPTQALELLIRENWEALRPLPGQEAQEAPEKDPSGDRIGETLNSILYALHHFEFGFSLVQDPQSPALDNIFDNFFDSGAHHGSRGYINCVKGICRMILSDQRCRAADPEGNLTQAYTQVAQAMLRFAKLYAEEV